MLLPTSTTAPRHVDPRVVLGVCFHRLCRWRWAYSSSPVAARGGSSCPINLRWRGLRGTDEDHSKELGLHTGLTTGQGLAHRGLNLYDQIAEGGFHVFKELFTTAKPAKAQKCLLSCSFQEVSLLEPDLVSAVEPGSREWLC